MRETEAKTKMCPYKTDHRVTHHPEPDKRDGFLKTFSQTEFGLCEGSECMAWRTLPMLTVDRPQGMASIGGQSVSHVQGYCGLAGRP